MTPPRSPAGERLCCTPHYCIDRARSELRRAGHAASVVSRPQPDPTRVDWDELCALTARAYAAVRQARCLVEGMLPGLEDIGEDYCEA